MADRSAKITVGIEGAEEAAAAAGRVSGAWQSAGGSIGKSFEKLGSTVGGAVSGMIKDLTRLTLVAQGINLAKGMADARAYGESMMRFSAVSGRSIGDLKTKFEGLARQKLVPEREIADFSKSVTRLTYDARGAVDSFAGMADEALATGKAAGEMVPLSVALHNTYGVAGDATLALGHMRAAGEALGTVGGPAAFADMLEGATGVLGQFGDKLDAAHKQALVLAVGAGLKPAQQKEVFSRIMGDVVGDMPGNARMMHMSQAAYLKKYTDAKTGAYKDPEQMLFDYGKAALRGSGSNPDTQLARLTNMLGSPMAARSLMNVVAGGQAGVDRAATRRVSTEAADTAARLKQTDSGQQIASEIARSIAERKLGDRLNPLATKAGQFAADNPMTALVGFGVAGNLAADAAGAMVRSLFSFGGGIASTTAPLTGLATSATAASLSLGTAASGLAALGAGFAVGSWLDEKLHLSDAISGTGQSSTTAHDSDVEVEADMRKHDAIRAAKAEKKLEKQVTSSNPPGIELVGMPSTTASAQPVHVKIDITDKTLSKIDAVVDGQVAPVQ